ncbi:unnamed protein product [Gongylonema pulchrum]|uniref:glucuronosyltransferase n=1 Tax=Gongylonema pulchrum TaxID=637853 RepID=A0A183CW44_9BILA|nr:unnamed protein product [Gongylonema pulchrum]
MKVLQQKIAATVPWTSEQLNADSKNAMPKLPRAQRPPQDICLLLQQDDAFTVLIEWNQYDKFSEEMLTTAEMPQNKLQYYWYFVYYFFVICLVPLNGYKILVFNPRFGKSHVRFMGNIADTLVEAGHDVTQFAPILNPVADTNGSRLAKTITLAFDKKLNKMLDMELFIQNSWKQQYQSIFGIMNVSSMRLMFIQLTDYFITSCELQLQNTKIMNQLRHEKFDLAITELFDPCPLGKELLLFFKFSFQHITVLKNNEILKDVVMK